ncbi:MAG: glycerol-3-phosphate acyltransferase [Desulfobacteraceae bacterium]|nr:glycerol-3-phosphate acyltransferase [Desulfobacteraceae bacterium]
MYFILFAVFAYCMGSVNFAIVFLRLMGKQDPRNGFSGNPGATNVYRQAGLPAAALVLLFDIGRAVAVSAAAMYIFPAPAVAWSALALLAGNRYPCFHGFSGGKGVANYLGFSAVIVPAAALVSCAAWAAVFWLARRPFAGSFAMVAILSGASILKWKDSPLAVGGAVVAALFIVFNHRANVAEVFSGNNRK